MKKGYHDVAEFYKHDRELGYYWVFDGYMWLIAEWDGEYWQECGSCYYNDSQYDKIDERKLEYNE